MIKFTPNTKQVTGFVNDTIDANDKAMIKMLNSLGLEIIKDALTKPPTPRIDTGQARGSWSIKVGFLPVKYNDGRFGQNKASGMLSPETTGMRPYEVRVGFNVPYAYNIHEGVFENGDEMGFGVKSEAATPKTGNFFLSQKFETRKKVWLDRSQEWYADFIVKEFKAL